MQIRDWIAIAVGVITIAGGTWAASELFARKDATAARFRVIAMRLDHKILEDQASALQERIWRWDDRYGKGCQTCDGDTRDDYREASDKLHTIKEQLRIIYEQMKKGGG